MSDRNAAISQLDAIHCRAICDEIGERLREVLEREIPAMPPHLQSLLDRLAQLDEAPSIVPSIDEMTVAQARAPYRRLRRSADLAMAATNHG
jgi:hypothetical protein